MGIFYIVFVIVSGAGAGYVYFFIKYIKTFLQNESTRHFSGRTQSPQIGNTRTEVIL